MSVQRRDEKISYDMEHDVLYIFFGKPRFGYEDEISPGIFIRKDDCTDEVIGAIVMDYQRLNKDHLANILPFKIDFERIHQNFVQ
ncbi:DUF2283 domain-containing protein [Thermoactinomyces mirandus]|uniref:DUF2283 domain-containing protein n=1 Tax=Thermoactinomyces mirandus TaxID=2756294 RepID=A0A7W2AR22_9BACL|nr:DUF2283 domain-containing protein [Thermoactinomyces mirandus]MBA4601867.1 DUF2283 domain-containing protein [Thermoactinomyces mirandus]